MAMKRTLKQEDRRGEKMTLTIWKSVGLIIVSVISAIVFSFIAINLIGLALPNVGEATFTACLVMGFWIPSICILASIHTKAHHNHNNPEGNKEHVNNNDNENLNL